MTDVFLSRILKPIVSRALKKILGGIFELEKKTFDLELAVLRGVITLTDLTLRPHVFSLPGFELVKGTVGKLELNIPWHRLSSESIRVSLANVRLNFRPSTTTNVSPSNLKTQKLYVRELLSEAEGTLEEENDLEDEDKEISKGSVPSNPKSRKKWVEQIVANMSLTCHDMTISWGEISCILDSFELQPIDSEGFPTFIRHANQLPMWYQGGHLRGFVMKSRSDVILVSKVEQVAFKIKNRTFERSIECTVPNLVIPNLQDAFDALEQLKPIFPLEPQARSRKLTLKECVDFVLRRISLGRKGFWWKRYFEALRTRNQYIDLYKLHLQQRETLMDQTFREKVELDLDFQTIFLYRAFAQSDLAVVKKPKLTMKKLSSKVLTSFRSKVQSSISQNIRQDQQARYEQVMADRTHRVLKTTFSFAFYCVEVSSLPFDLVLKHVSFNQSGFLVGSLEVEKYLQFKSVLEIRRPSFDPSSEEEELVVPRSRRSSSLFHLKTDSPGIAERKKRSTSLRSPDTVQIPSSCVIRGIWGETMEIADVSFTIDDVLISKLFSLRYPSFLSSSSSSSSSSSKKGFTSFLLRKLTINFGHKAVFLKVDSSRIKNGTWELKSCALSNNRTKDFSFDVSLSRDTVCLTSECEGELDLIFSPNLLSLMATFVSFAPDKTSSTSSRRVRLLSCTMPFKCSLADSGFTFLCWKSVLENEVKGPIALVFDNENIFHINEGLRMSRDLATATFVGDFFLKWNGSLMRRLVVLLSPFLRSFSRPRLQQQSSNESTWTIQTEHSVSVQLLDAESKSFCTMTSRGGGQFRSISNWMINDLLLSSSFFSQDEVHVFSSSNISCSRNLCTVAGLTTLVYQLSFWLECNDLIQTQVLSLFPSSSSSSSGTDWNVEFLGKALLRLYPVPFLPSINQVKRIEALAEGGTVSLRSFLRDLSFSVHASFKQVAWSFISSQSTLLEMALLPEVNFLFEISQKPIDSTATLLPLVLGVCRQRPLLRPTFTQIRLSETNLLVHLNFSVLSCLQRIASQNFKDQRRQRISVDDVPLDSNRSRFSLDSLHDVVKLRHLQIIVPASVELHFSPVPSVLTLFKSIEVNSILAYSSETKSFHRKFQMDAFSGLKLDVHKVGWFSCEQMMLQRFSQAFGWDEVFRLQVGGKMVLSILQVMDDGLQKALFGGESTTVGTTQQWAKDFEVSVNGPIQVNGGMGTISFVSPISCSFPRTPRVYSYSLPILELSGFPGLVGSVEVRLDGQAFVDSASCQQQQHSFSASLIRLSCTRSQMETWIQHVYELYAKFQQKFLPQKKKKKTSQSSWMMSIDGFHLVLCDSFEHLPAFRILLSKCIVKKNPHEVVWAMMNDDQGLNGIVCNYFNHSLVEWEPVVEPVVFEWSVQENHFHFGALGPLCVNVTASLCDTLFRFNRTPAVEEEASTVLTLLDSEWLFFNDLGESVEIGLGDRLPWLHITNGETRRLPQACRSIRFLSSTYHPLESLPSKVGYHVIPLIPVYSETTVRICRFAFMSMDISASTEGNALSLHLSSNLVVENCLDLPIEFLFSPRFSEEESMGQSSLFGPVLPHTQFSVPLSHIASMLSVRVDPENSTSTWWQNDLDLLMLSESATASSFCASSGKWCFQVQVLDLKRGRFKLRFLPWVSILNALPMEVEFRLGAQRRIVNSQETIGVLGKDKDDDARIFFRLANSSWTHAVSFVSSKSGGDIELEVEDLSGREIKFLLRFLPCQSILLFARVWLRNFSRIDLSYRAGERKLFSRNPTETNLKLGSSCVYLYNGKWVPAVIVHTHTNGFYDVFLTEYNLKLTQIPDASLQRNSTQQEECVIYTQDGESFQLKVRGSPHGWSRSFSLDDLRSNSTIEIKNSFGQNVALNLTLSSLHVFSLQRVLVVSIYCYCYVDCLVDKSIAHCSIVLEDQNLIELEFGKRRDLHVTTQPIRFQVNTAMDGIGVSGPIVLRDPPFEDALHIVNTQGKSWILKLHVSWSTDQHYLLLQCSMNTSPPLYLLLNHSAEVWIRIKQVSSTLEAQTCDPGTSCELGWESREMQDTMTRWFQLLQQDDTDDNALLIRPDDLSTSDWNWGSLRVTLELKDMTKCIVIRDALLDSRDSADHLVRSVLTKYSFFLQLPHVVFSVVDTFPQEICTVNLFALKLQGRVQGDGLWDTSLLVDYVQMDNALLNARLPVIMWPVRGGASPFLNCQLQFLSSSWSLISCRLFALQLAQFDLLVEEQFLILAFRMWKECSSVPVHVSREKEEKKSSFSFLSRKVFVETVRLDPISFSLTIQRLVEPLIPFSKWKGPGTLMEEKNVDTYFPLPISLTDVDRATVVLSCFAMTRMLFPTVTALGKELKVVYTKEMFANVTRILSKELMRIISPIGSSIRANEDGSMLLHGAVNTLDTASRVSNTIGTGVAFLSFDPKYIQARRQTQLDERADGFASGALLAAKALSQGVVFGLSGIVYQPAVGAMEQGVPGFVSGLGKGLLGVGVLPVVGLFDMVSAMFAGARSATAWLDPSETPRRIRLPRTFHGETRCLKPFDPRFALCQELVIKVWSLERWREQGGNCDYFLSEADLLLLINVNSRFLLCIDYSAYATLLEHTDPLSTFQAAKPVLAWEIDGSALPTSNNVVVQDHHVLIELTHFQNGVSGGNAEGVCIGSGRASGVVHWEQGRWILRLPTFSPEGLGFLLRALHDVLHEAVGENRFQISFGLCTTVLGNQCVVSGVTEQSLAEQSGFQVGDTVLSVLGQKEDPQGTVLHHAVTFLTRQADGSWIDVLVERDGGFRKKLIVKFPKIAF